MKIATLTAVYKVKKKANKEDNSVFVWVYRNKDKMPLVGTSWSAKAKAEDVFKWVKLNIEKAENPTKQEVKENIELRKLFNL